MFFASFTALAAFVINSGLSFDTAFPEPINSISSLFVVCTSVDCNADYMTGPCPFTGLDSVDDSRALVLLLTQSFVLYSCQDESIIAPSTVL